MHLYFISDGKIAGGAEGSDLSSCTFPGICVLPGGHMIASFKGSPLKGPLAGENGYLCYSDDGGETWSDPIMPLPEAFTYKGRAASFRGIYATHLEGARVLAVTPVVYEDAGGTPYFNHETEGILDTDIFFTHSDDEGRSFGTPERMDTSPFIQPTPLTGPVIRNPDGSLVCQFELNKTYYDLNPWVHSSVLTFSRDGGCTWGGATAITRHPSIYYWDQRIGIMDDGRLLNLFWTFDREKAEYLTIHACDSADGGRTWSSLWDTGLPGQPGAPADIGNGRVAVIYIDRTGSPRIEVKISEDGGRTFLPETLTIYDSGLQKQEYKKSGMDDAWDEMGAFSVGHPNLIMLPSGVLYAYYYAGPHTDRTDIRWTKIGIGS